MENLKDHPGRWISDPSSFDPSMIGNFGTLLSQTRDLVELLDARIKQLESQLPERTQLHFLLWLKDQSHRRDPVGEVSTYLLNDFSFNGFSYSDLRRHFKNSRSPFRIREGLRLARSEYRLLIYTPVDKKKIGG